MLRILHVASVLDSESGSLVPRSLPRTDTGVATGNHTEALAQAQARIGERTVAIFARGKRAGVPVGTEERSEDDGRLILRVHLGEGPLRRPHNRTRWDLAASFRRFVAEWKPDVVHFQHLLYHSLDYPAIARRAGATTVLTLHDLWFTCPTSQREDFRGRACERTTGRGCLPCLWEGKEGEKEAQERIARIAHGPTGKLLDLVSLNDEVADWATNTKWCLESVDLVISASPAIADDLKRHGINHPNLVIHEGAAGVPDEAGVAYLDSLYTGLRRARAA